LIRRADAFSMKEARRIAIDSACCMKQPLSYAGAVAVVTNNGCEILLRR
jgi:hypothetical protein